MVQPRARRRTGRDRDPGPGIRHYNGFVGTMPNEGMAGDGAVNVLDHVGISVPDVRAAVELIREIGGEIRTEPQVGVTAPLISHVTDPWGGRFELLEDPEYRYQPRPYLRVGCRCDAGLVPPGIRG